jgi:hypothetical protein
VKTEDSTLEMSVASRHQLSLFCLLVRTGQILQTTIWYEPDVDSSHVRSIKHDKELRVVSGTVVGVYFKDDWLVAELRTTTGSKHYSIKLCEGLVFKITGFINSLDRILWNYIKQIRSTKPTSCVVLDTTGLSVVSTSHYKGTTPLKSFILPQGEPTSAKERAKEVLTISRVNHITTLLCVTGACKYTRSAFLSKDTHTVVDVPFYTGDSELIEHAIVRRRLCLTKLEDQFKTVRAMLAAQSLFILNFESIVQRLVTKRTQSIAVVCANCSAQQFLVLGRLLDGCGVSVAHRVRLITSLVLNHRVVGFSVVSIQTDTEY